MKKNLKIINDSLIDECGDKIVAVAPYRNDEEQEQALLKCQEILSINDEED